MRKAQQAMSRKTKFSNNWKKAKAEVQRIHSRIGHARRDYLHKTSTTISQNHAMVCIEDLQVRNMSKSAAVGLQAALEWRHSGYGHVSKDNRPTQVQFACVECGFEENADVVGAINVLRAGHARFACEVSGAVMPRLSAVGISSLQAGEDVNKIDCFVLGFL